MRSRLAAGMFAIMMTTGLTLSIAVNAAADNVIADDQIVQGNECLGPSCANGESFGAIEFIIKADDTPVTRLLQTGNTFAAQTWDVAGNEANFFVRDTTNGSKLPFRIRPGAPTSSIDIATNSEVSSVGIFTQNVTPTSGIVDIGSADGEAILAALRNLPVDRYRLFNDSGNTPHLAPPGAAFRSAFGLGSSDDLLAPADVAAVALVGVKQLDQRVSNLAPGLQGPAGPAADLSQANKKISSLEKSNKRLSRSLRSLRRQVRKLARGAG